MFHMYKFSVFHKYCKYEKIIHAWNLENGPFVEYCFFQLQQT